MELRHLWQIAFFPWLEIGRWASDVGGTVGFFLASAGLFVFCSYVFFMFISSMKCDIRVTYKLNSVALKLVRSVIFNRISVEPNGFAGGQ